MSPPAGPPPWMQRAARQEAPPPGLPSQQQDYHPSAVHPLQRYAAPHAAPEPDYHPAPPLRRRRSRARSVALRRCAVRPARSRRAAIRSTIRPMRTIPTPIRTAMTTAPRSRSRKRRGGMITVAVVLALAVVGTGAAFAYRTYVGSPRSGEPPIIKADTSPTKIVPAPADGSAKVPDRMAAGDGTEKIVPREEAPVDVNAKSGPRVVFPPLNQNANPPSAASVAPAAPPPATAGNGTLPNNEPRKIRTFRSAATSPIAPAAAGRPRRRRRRKTGAAPRGAATRAAPRSRQRLRQCRAPMRRCRCRRRPLSRRRRGTANPGGHQHPGPDRAAAAPSGGERRIPGSGLLAAERGRRPGLLPGAAGQVPGGAGIALAADQARRSRRQGRLLPRHGRSVRLARRGLAVLRQPENRRRAVRRPKELTAVSLTLGRPAG